MVLRNPVEDYFFIPKEIDYYATQIDLDFDRTDGFKITNFVDVGVIESDSLTLDDPMITDNCLRNLMRWMCFDIEYQKLEPEVKTAIEVFLSNLESPELEKLKNRVRPFMEYK